MKKLLIAGAIILATALLASAAMPPPFNRIIHKIARVLASPGDVRVVIGGADTRTTINGDRRVIQ